MVRSRKKPERFSDEIALSAARSRKRKSPDPSPPSSSTETSQITDEEDQKLPITIVQKTREGGSDSDDFVEMPPVSHPNKKASTKTDVKKPKAAKAKQAPVKTEESNTSTKKKPETPEDDESDDFVDKIPLFNSNKQRKPVTETVQMKSDEVKFKGKPIPAPEARSRWPHRYIGLDKAERSKETQNKNDNKTKKEAESTYCQALRHYYEAQVDGTTYKLDDDVYVKGDGDKDKDNFIARIIEFFESTDKGLYFTARWYYRMTDTIIEERVLDEHKDIVEEKRVLYSTVMDDNALGCLVRKIKIVRLAPTVAAIEAPDADFYCDMAYDPVFSTTSNLPTVATEDVGESFVVSCKSSCKAFNEMKNGSAIVNKNNNVPKLQMKLLDLYAGCGAMSTGLCLGAAKAGVELVTRWAVDMNKHACATLKANHPEAEVRNESAEDFLALLKKWEELCKKCSLLGDKIVLEKPSEHESELEDIDDMEMADADVERDVDDGGEYEVEKIVGICYGDPKEIGEQGLYLKVHWKGFTEAHDSWEPYINLDGCCDEAIKEFVADGYNSKILPLPGDADVICGGPPCQGISGFNRFRDSASPLSNPKNYQLIVFMNIVEYLKPKYVLMENVADILKFAKGYLGRYAVGRLTALKYQSRIGLMAAGSYGLPQFRLRAFFWGATPSEKLPQFPLPTHKVIGRGSVPQKFAINYVCHDEDCSFKLQDALQLKDVLSDFPKITNDEKRDEIPYEPEDHDSEFIKKITMSKDGTQTQAVLYDHRPLNLNVDDYQRTCRVPKRKGANFRDFPGVLVDSNNVVYFDPKVDRVYLPSKNPLVPDYAMSFVKGKSKKPFGRVWWDEIVNTVVTRAEPHNQRILHPNQDRVLSVRENARIQGFPDYYKLFGDVKDRYVQVGNAVAVPVGCALGYALGLASNKISNDDPLLTLPTDF